MVLTSMGTLGMEYNKDMFKANQFDCMLRSNIDTFKANEFDCILILEGNGRGKM